MRDSRPGATAADNVSSPMSVHDPAAKLRPLNPQLSTREYLVQMWGRRDFAVALPMEELRSTHSATFLGNVWHLGNPLLTSAVYYVIFGQILGTDRGIDNYILWLMIGVFAFGLTTRSVLGGAMAISSNQGLMRAVRFPRALLPVSIVLSRLLTFGFELLVIVVVAIVTGEGISQRWLALPLVIGLHTVLNMGGAFVAARLNDSFRDVQQIIPFVFQLGRYISGVMFPIERFLSDGAAQQGLAQRVVGLNPLVTMLNLYRWVFLGTPVSLGELTQLVVISVLLLVVGFNFFRGAEWRYGRN